MHHHEHHHNHSDMTVVLFFAGLISFIVGSLVSRGYPQLATICFLLTVVASGYHVIYEGIGSTIHNTKKQRKFSPNIHFLMAVATIGAIVIGELKEAALLILIFSGAHYLEEYVQSKSYRDITELLKMNPTQARRINSDGVIEQVTVDEVNIGDHLQVLVGDQISADGVIISGAGFINEATITGESLPKEKSIGDEVFSSTLNEQGQFIMKVTKDNEESLFSTIIKMVDQAQHQQTKTATLIQKLEPKYVTVVLMLYPIVVLLGYFAIGWSWQDTFYHSMVYLISVSPCALAASAIPATLSAMSHLSKKGILVKGGDYLSQIASANVIAFDKTGTITKGKPVVTDTYFSVSYEEQEHLIDMIVAMEQQSNHPLAQAILEAFGERNTLQVQVENHIGKGLVAYTDSGMYQIGKVSLFTTESTIYEEYIKKWSSEGKTVIGVAKDQQLLGILALIDLPSEQSSEVIQYFTQHSVETMLLTGDAELTAATIAKEVGITNVVANVLPSEKSYQIQNLQKNTE